MLVQNHAARSAVTSVAITTVLDAAPCGLSSQAGLCDRLCTLNATFITPAWIVGWSPVEKLCITLRRLWDWSVNGGFQGCHLMDAEVLIDGLRVVVQIVNPGFVTLVLSGDRVPCLLFPRVEQQRLDGFQPHFNAAKAYGDGVVWLRHLWSDGSFRDCCGPHPG